MREEKETEARPSGAHYSLHILTMRVTGSAKAAVVVAAALLQSEAPHSLPSTWDTNALHLEQCYALTLERALTPIEDPRGTWQSTDDCVASCGEGAASEVLRVPTKGADGKVSVGAAGEHAAVKELGERLPAICACCCTSLATTLWGVDLSHDSAERASLLSAFLRARDWSVDASELFLRETLAWRREQGMLHGMLRPGGGGSGMACGESGAPAASLPDDQICTRLDADGQLRTYVIISMGSVSREALERPEGFVRWRIQQQERVCEYLGTPYLGTPRPEPLLEQRLERRSGRGGGSGGSACSGGPGSSHCDGAVSNRDGGVSHWRLSPRGPTYTLVLDCRGLRPYHFGRCCRRALGMLEEVFTHYYPDFVGGTLVINSPCFVERAWAVIGRLMPAWWGVQLGSMCDLEGAAVGAVV